jgi:hypothetical protein
MRIVLHYNAYSMGLYIIEDLVSVPYARTSNQN